MYSKLTEADSRLGQEHVLLDAITLYDDKKSIAKDGGVEKRSEQLARLVHFDIVDKGIMIVCGIESAARPEGSPCLALIVFL